MFLKCLFLDTEVMNSFFLLIKYVTYIITLILLGYILTLLKHGWNKKDQLYRFNYFIRKN